MTTNKMGAKIKEFFRKQIVSLKRKPQKIPFISIVLMCLIYCSGLTAYSNSSIAVYSQDITWVNYSALGIFVVMLFSLLTIFTFLFAYGKDNNSKTKKTIMLTLVYIFLATELAFAIFVYYVFYFRTTVTITGTKIVENVEKAFVAIPVEKSADISKAMKTLVWVMVFDVISVLLLAFQPLYAKLIRKINTTVDSDDFQVNDLDETAITKEDN